MSTEVEKVQAIKDALSITEKRLKELNEKKVLTRNEKFEKDQAIYMIHLGRKVLGFK